MVCYVTTFVNAVPSKLGVSIICPPQECFTQRKLDIARDCNVQFGTYVEASDNTIITNTMKLRTHACITLGPSINWQGSMLCFDLETAKVVTRKIVTEYARSREGSRK